MRVIGQADSATPGDHRRHLPFRESPNVHRMPIDAVDVEPPIRTLVPERFRGNSDSAVGKRLHHAAHEGAHPQRPRKERATWIIPTGAPPPTLLPPADSLYPCVDPDPKFSDIGPGAAPEAHASPTHRSATPRGGAHGVGGVGEKTRGSTRFLPHAPQPSTGVRSRPIRPGKCCSSNGLRSSRPKPSSRVDNADGQAEGRSIRTDGAETADERTQHRADADAQRADHRPVAAVTGHVVGRNSSMVQPSRAPHCPLILGSLS
jgi:hypothetical protein